MAVPKITVLMPVYNGEKYLREAMDSILTQTFQDFEFIIVNDGSTDASAKIVQSYTDSRIRLVNNEKNMGLIASLNRGLELAKSEYIARMDQDDISFPLRLEKQVAFMDTHKDVGVCGTWFQFFKNNNLSVIKKFPSDHQTIVSNLFFEDVIGHPTVMIRKSVLDKYQLRYNPEHINAEDYGLWIGCAVHCQLANIPEILLRYRVNQTSITALVNQNPTQKLARKQALKQIYQLGLALINLNYSLEELDFHYELLNTNFIDSIDFLNTASNWLLKIRKYNLDKLYYSEPIFSNLISLKWFRVCEVANPLGVKAFLIYQSSELAGIQPISISKKIIFLLKCIIRWGFIKKFIKFLLKKFNGVFPK